MHACLPACLPACLSLSLSQVPGLPGVDPGKYDALIAIRMTALMRSAMSASAFADDKQSLAHLFWFGDEVDVVGLVADWAFMTVPSLTASAIEEIEIAIQRYEADYFAGGGSGTRFQVGGWGGIRASGAEQSRAGGHMPLSISIDPSLSACLVAQDMGFPSPDYYRSIIPTTSAETFALFHSQVQKASSQEPLYVLIWGECGRRCSIGRWMAR